MLLNFEIRQFQKIANGLPRVFAPFTGLVDDMSLQLSYKAD